MNNLMQEIGELGRGYRYDRSAILRAALAITEAAVNGEVEWGDADKLYLAFHHNHASLLPPRNKQSYRSQLSKIRKFISFGKNEGKFALIFLAKARDIHTKLVREQNPNLRYLSGYSALLDLMQEQTRPERIKFMTKAEIEQFMTRGKIPSERGK